MISNHLKQPLKTPAMQRFYALLAFFFATTLSHSQVVINEFSAANLDGITDNFGEREDWIELYNIGSQPVNLTGYFLSDKINNTDKWEFPAGVTIGGNAHLLIFASDRDLVTGGEIHAGFKITQTKQEYIALFDPQQNLVDAVQITIPNQANHSRGRVTDGAIEWGVFTTPSPEAANANARKEYATRPQPDVEAGFYTGSVTVVMTADAGDQIRYTLDGSEPTVNSMLYSNPITLSQTTVVKARAYSADPLVPASFTEANTYFINVTHTVPVISIAGGDISQLMNGFQNEPRGSFEYFDKGAFLDEAYGEFNKHGNDSWAYNQRGIDYITRDQMGYTSSINHQIFPLKDRGNFQRLILKPAANDNFSFQDGAHIRDAYVHTLAQRASMELDARTYEPSILYVNGEYWGVYETREKVDDPDYTLRYYNQGEKWLDFIKTWGNTWEEYGSRADWDVLHNFITNNDMSIPSNYQYVKERLNLLSLIDYMILNTHVVCMDWLNWNTAWWRGRKPDGEARQWRYALWDLDATFGHYINYTNIPNTTPNADPCYAEDLPSDFEGHGELIQALLANEEFHSLYVNRYADMNNTFFTCEYMQSLLDSMIARIAPEMPGQVQRWGGSMNDWLENVQELKDFIDTRCTVINGGIEGCYDVIGPFPVTVKIEPQGFGNAVKVNTFVPASFPYTGDYFSGTTLSFAGVPASGWEIDHWEVMNSATLPDQYADTINISLVDTLGDMVTAFFRPAIPCEPAYDFTIDSTLSSISLEWKGPVNNISYELGYRVAGSGADWNTFSLLDPAYVIYGLDICSDYEIRVRSICDFSLGEYVEFVKKTACLVGNEEAVASVVEWNVFPNPFFEKATADFVLNENTSATIKVLTPTGKAIFEENTVLLSTGQHRVALEANDGWSAGVFLVQLITEKGTVTKRLVKG
jgi:hypothetical protein